MYMIRTEVYCPTNGSLEGLRVDFFKELWLHFPWKSFTLVGGNIANVLLGLMSKCKDDEIKNEAALS